MPRPLAYLILVIVVLVAAIYLLASQSAEVPTAPIEVDVTNAAGA